MVMTRISQPCSTLRLCLELITCELEDEDKAPDPDADGRASEGRGADGSASPPPPLHDELKEKVEAVEWIALNSLVAIPTSFTPPPTYELEAEADSSVQQAAPAHTAASDNSAVAAGSSPLDRPQEDANEETDPKEEEGTVMFCTAKDGIQRLLGPHIVSQNAWFNKYCSVMLGFRPDLAVLPRLSLRLFSLHTGVLSRKDAAQCHFVVDFGPDTEAKASNDSLQRFSTWTSGCPILEEGGASGTSAEGYSMVFRSQCVRVFDLGACTSKEQATYGLCLRLQTRQGKALAHAFLTLPDFLRFSSLPPASSTTATKQLLSTRRHSFRPLPASALKSVPTTPAAPKAGIFEMDLEAQGSHSLHSRADKQQAFRLRFQLSRQSDWAQLEQLHQPSTYAPYLLSIYCCSTYQ